MASNSARARRGVSSRARSAEPPACSTQPCRIRHCARPSQSPAARKRSRRRGEQVPRARVIAEQVVNLAEHDLALRAAVLVAELLEERERARHEAPAVRRRGEVGGDVTEQAQAVRLVLAIVGRRGRCARASSASRRASSSWPAWRSASARQRRCIASAVPVELAVEAARDRAASPRRRASCAHSGRDVARAAARPRRRGRPARSRLTTRWRTMRRLRRRGGARARRPRRGRSRARVGLRGRAALSRCSWRSACGQRSRSAGREEDLRALHRRRWPRSRIDAERRAARRASTSRRMSPPSAAAA